MNEQLRDNGYLDDIRTAIEKVDRYTQNMSFEDFMSNELVQDAVLRNIGVVGEAVSKLSDGLTAKYPAIPWANISGMRNRLVHDYNGVNLSLVWNTIKKVIPGFLASVAAIQKDENDGSATSPPLKN